MDLTDFVDIIGYEGLYKINNNGEVWSCNINKIMKQRLNHYGYYSIKLGQKNNQKHYGIHRLLAINFIPNNDINKTEVDHIDGNRTNNNIENLRWVTHTENARNVISTTNYITEYIRKETRKIIYVVDYPVYINNKRTRKRKQSTHRHIVEEFVEQMKKDYPNLYASGRLT